MADQMTARDHDENLQYVRRLASTSGKHILDLSDDRQWEYLQASARKSGVTPETYPNYFAALERTRARHRANGGPAVATAAEDAGHFAEAHQVTSLGLTEGGSNSHGGGFSSVAGGTVFTRLQVYILDLKTGDPLAFADSGLIMGQGFHEALHAVGNPPSANDGMALIYTYSYLPNGTPAAAGAEAGEVVAGVATRVTTEGPVGAPVVVQPVKTTTSNNYLKIALSSPQPRPDVDYWYNEPNVENPNLRLPMVGSQQFASDIVTPLFGTDPPNCVVTAFLSSSGGGTGVPLPATREKYPVSIVAQGKTLNWSFPWNNDVARDGSMQFGSAAWGTDSAVLSYFGVQVKTATSGNQWVFVNIYSTSQPPWAISPAPGTYWQYPIYYVWHCVAAGTLVTCADGSTLKIEELTAGDTVRAGLKGDAFTVVDTLEAEKKATVLSLRTEAGHELLITDFQPVRTEQGLTIARELRAGTVVLTDKGPSKVRSIEPGPYEGMVYCIGLGADDEEQRRFTMDDTCFYANGVLVGDSRLSLRTREQWHSSLEAILERLPRQWHAEAKAAHALRAGLSASW